MRIRSAASAAIALVTALSVIGGGPQSASGAEHDAGPVAVAGAPLHYATNTGYATKPASVGFNLWDTGADAGEVNALPAGQKALVWIGDSYGDCEPVTVKDADFERVIDRLANNDKVWGWFIWDEPDLSRCKGLLDRITYRADYIHTRSGGMQKAFVMGGGGDGEPADSRLAPNQSGLDYIGIDPYPCRTSKSCDYAMIDRAVNGSLANGVPRGALVPTFQAFGQTCNTGPHDMRIPTSTEMRQIFARWDSLLPSPVFDYTYSWGVQQEWSCPALSTVSSLQTTFRQRFLG